MKKTLNALMTAAMLIAGPIPAFAQQPAADPHAHDAQASAPANSQASAQTMRQMDEHMKRMQSLHERMMQASTPEERQKVMDEARKEMQAGMSTMGPMMQGMMAPGKGTKGEPTSEARRLQMMEKRMDMMQMMMQMMMDQQAAAMPHGPSGATGK